MPIPPSPHPTRAPRRLVRDRVYAQIREAILTGVLLPGERLDEAKLREWLGVSSTPIREALHTLAVEGYVDSAPQSYTAVAPPQPERARENFQTIGVLLCGMSLLTLPVTTVEQRTRLASLADAAVPGRRNGSDRPAIEAYFEALVEMCPNPALVQLAIDAGTSLAYQLTVSHERLDGDLSPLADGFETLRDALVANDLARAECATRRIFLLD